MASIDQHRKFAQDLFEAALRGDDTLDISNVPAACGVLLRDLADQLNNADAASIAATRLELALLILGGATVSDLLHKLADVVATREEPEAQTANGGVPSLDDVLAPAQPAPSRNPDNRRVRGGGQGNRRDRQPAPAAPAAPVSQEPEATTAAPAPKVRRL